MDTDEPLEEPPIESRNLCRNELYSSRSSDLLLSLPRLNGDVPLSRLFPPADSMFNV